MIPKLWHQTIQAHRHEVREAILDTAAALVAQHGLRAVTMSQIADETGIGRATLYKYFSGVEPILIAWHERHVANHLERLRRLRNEPGEPGQRLEAVFNAYALIAFERHKHAPELATIVHQGHHLLGPEQQLVELLGGLIGEASAAGAVRADMPVGELAIVCLRALEGARSLSSKLAVERLVRVVVDGLRAR